MLRLLAVLFDLLLLPLRVLARARAVPKGAFLTLEIDGAVVDLAAPRRFLRRPDRAVAIAEVRELATEATDDARVRGLVVTVTSLRAGMAAVTSLRDQLARVRAAGKELVFVLPSGGGTKEVYLASIGTRVVVGPAAMLAPVGFLTRTRYFRTALERAGLEASVFACGEFKSAGETLVRDAMSEGQRVQMNALLDGFESALIHAIAEGRGLGAEGARKVVDGGPYTGREAVTAGLATDVAYEDEVPALLALPEKRGAHPAPARGLVPAARYLRTRRPLVRPLRRAPVVAVLPVHGAIAHTEGMLGRLSTDERVARMARAARLDPRVVGCILHVDSPGGSSLASDRMHHEIARLAREKPVVACFANVAASGGYYVGVAARRIVAEPTTVTGSIGVVAMRLGANALLARLGVSTTVMRRGDRAGLLAADQPLTEDERGALAHELDVTYETFLRVVAEGRGRSRDEIEPLARGRVYTGKDAHALGLVDVLGGFDVALRELRGMLPERHASAEPVLLHTPKKRVPLLRPASAPAASATRAVLSAVLGLLPPRERTLVALAASGERIHALAPEILDAAGPGPEWHEDGLSC